MPYCPQSEMANARMALTYLPLAILVCLNYIVSGNGTLSSISTGAKGNALLDPELRNNLVEKAFSEQKDILLDMLEAKLKEVRDRKKKKNEHFESDVRDTKCKPTLNNVNLNLKSSGIISVGEADVQLKLGEDGNGILNLSASGISNVGKTYLNLGLGNGTIHIPGLDNLFTELSLNEKPCDKQENIENRTQIVYEAISNDTQSRRSMGFDQLTENDLVTLGSQLNATESTNVTDEITTVVPSTNSEEKEYN